MGAAAEGSGEPAAGGLDAARRKKELDGYVALDLAAELSRLGDLEAERSQAGGAKVLATLGASEARVRCPEVLFEPGTWAGTTGERGVGRLVGECVAACDVDIRRDLCCTGRKR
jgi:hypothetical protein